MPLIDESLPLTEKIEKVYTSMIHPAKKVNVTPRKVQKEKLRKFVPLYPRKIPQYMKNKMHVT